VSAEDITSTAEHYYCEEPAPDKKPNSRKKTATWSEYKFRPISVSQTHHNNYQNLEKLGKSAFIPKQYERLVRKYLDVAGNNVVLIGEILTEASKELPEKYPNVEALKRISLLWIENRYTKKFKLLEPFARKIEAFVREYLGTDTLLSRR